MNAKVTEQLILRMREIAALLLWETGAIRVNVQEPFKLVSGNYSPIYINCRLVISNQVFMSLFTAFTRAILTRSNISVDVVAGGETAGIPFAAYLAKELSMPMIYVRKAKKDHGVSSLIEGLFSEGEKVVLVEDLITDAGSKMGFIDAIRASGGVVENVMVLFDRQQGGQEALQNMGVQLQAVTNMETAMNVAEYSGDLVNDDLNSVYEYLRSPRDWHKNRGLLFH